MDLVHNHSSSSSIPVSDISPILQLASRSPRRRELLEQIGVRYTVVDATVDEARSVDEPADDYVLRLARAKARAGYAVASGAPTLGADTIVVLGEDALGKPCNKAAAMAMLRRMSATSHWVFTAVALYDGNRLESVIVKTEVYFKALSDDLIARYWDTGEPKDKAGSYGIQGMGAIFVDRIEGSYSGVVGLPLTETSELCQRFGIKSWNLAVTGS